MSQIDSAIKQCFPAAPINELHHAMNVFNITTTEQQLCFIAQAAHESNNFRNTIENLNYSAVGLASTWPNRFSNNGKPNTRALSIARNSKAIAEEVYGGRMGNNSSGDGWKYRGRGYFQITGKSNYSQLGELLYDRELIDSPDLLVDNPDLVATPQYASLTAAAFWYKNNCNALVGNFKLLTRRINGGYNGLQHRLDLYNKLKNCL